MRWGLEGREVKKGKVKKGFVCFLAPGNPPLSLRRLGARELSERTVYSLPLPPLLPPRVPRALSLAPGFPRGCTLSRPPLSPLH